MAVRANALLELTAAHMDHTAENAHRDAGAWYRVGHKIETCPKMTELNERGRMREALPYYQQAAERGFPEGMYAYGQRLHSMGMRRQGSYWIKRAAKGGFPEAQKRYRRLRLKG